VFKLCTKFEQNRIICSWVIDDLAQFLRWSTFSGRFSGCVDPTSLNLGGHRAIIDACQVCFTLQISWSVLKRRRLKGNWNTNFTQKGCCRQFWFWPEVNFNNSATSVVPCQISRQSANVQWVIDNLAHFRRPILGGGAVSPDGSQECVDQTS